MSDHVHRLIACHDCGGAGVNNWDPGLCEMCYGRGYFEICAVCREPMGNRRRKWKREQREQRTEAAT